MHKTEAALFCSIVLLTTSSGCATTGEVALRSDGSPGPQECPEEAQKAMRYMGLHPGDSVLVELDANHVGSPSIITLYEGSIESVTKEEFGPLGTTSRLYGRVWTSGPWAVIRYYEAQSPNGEKVPFCAVARLGADQMRKRPESKPGTAIIESSIAAAFVVDAFR